MLNFSTSTKPCIMYTFQCVVSGLLSSNKILQELASESTSLCQLSPPSLLRALQPHSLHNIDLDKIAQEWAERSKLMYEVLQTVMGKKSSGANMRAMAAAGAIQLQQRCCPQMNALGLQLDFGGTRDKTIGSMAACGLTVGCNYWTEYFFLFFQGHFL